jgi:hypothetical protein
MRTGHAAAVCVLLALPGALAACADILSIDPPEDAAATPDSSLFTDAVAYGGGVPIHNFEASVCAQVGSPPSGAFFVSGKTGMDGPNCGPRSSPCASVGVAVMNASTNEGGGTIVMARGLYVETVVLKSNITIQGGWDENWTWICDPEAVQIRAPEGSYTTVLGDSVTATLESLTVTSSGVPPPEPPSNSSALGTSVYGILLTGGAQATLNDVVVVTGPAGNGGSGKPGAAGGTGASEGCDAGSGAAMTGATGSSGLPGQLGTFEPTGYTPLVGGTGGVGGTGEDSPSGACGGDPGQGGQGGGGGGCSIAVYLAGTSTIMTTGGLLQAGNGGNGGTGAVGGPGGNAGGSNAGTGGTGGTGGGGAAGSSWSVAGNTFGLIFSSSLQYGTAGMQGSGGNSGSSLGQMGHFGSVGPNP